MNVDFPRRVSLGFEDFLLTTQFAEKVSQGAEVSDVNKNLSSTNFKTTAGCLGLNAACGNGVWTTPVWSKVVGSGGFITTVSRSYLLLVLLPTYAFGAKSLLSSSLLFVSD